MICTRCRRHLSERDLAIVNLTKELRKEREQRKRAEEFIARVIRTVRGEHGHARG